jgi:hypothetical protein
MKITAQRRLAGLAGLLLLTLLAGAVFVSAAFAMHDAGSGTGGVAYAWTRNVSSTAGSSGTSVAGTQGRGGVSGQVTAVAPAPAAVTTPASSGMSSTAWIVIGVAVAALAVALVAWALARRRRRLASDTQQYCSLHPDDSLCGAV